MTHPQGWTSHNPNGPMLPPPPGMFGESLPLQSRWGSDYPTPETTPMENSPHPQEGMYPYAAPPSHIPHKDDHRPPSAHNTRNAHRYHPYGNSRDKIPLSRSSRVPQPYHFNNSRREIDSRNVIDEKQSHADPWWEQEMCSRPNGQQSELEEEQRALWQQPAPRSGFAPLSEYPSRRLYSTGDSDGLAKLQAVADATLRRPSMQDV